MINLKGVFVNLGNIARFLILIFPVFLFGCSSSKFVPTSDVCTIKKHFKDSIWQIKENGVAINNHWFLKTDAVRKIRLMEKANECNYGGAEKVQ